MSTPAHPVHNASMSLKSNFALMRSRLFLKPKNRCNDLLPAGRVLRELDLNTAEPLGRTEVPLERIIGSAGRYTNFDLGFRPVALPDRRRWERLKEVRDAGSDLPPVDLIQVGDKYLVMDGNHRIAVAAARGEGAIAARVTRLRTGQLIPDEKCTRLGYRLNNNGCPGEGSHCASRSC